MEGASDLWEPGSRQSSLGLSFLTWRQGRPPPTPLQGPLTLLSCGPRCSSRPPPATLSRCPLLPNRALGCEMVSLFQLSDLTLCLLSISRALDEGRNCPSSLLSTCCGGTARGHVIQRRQPPMAWAYHRLDPQESGSRAMGNRLGRREWDMELASPPAAPGGLLGVEWGSQTRLEALAEEGKS